jgi:hypothetical protein
LRCGPKLSAVGVVSSMRQVFEFEGHYPGFLPCSANELRLYSS